MTLVPKVAKQLQHLDHVAIAADDMPQAGTRSSMFAGAPSYPGVPLWPSSRRSKGADRSRQMGPCLEFGVESVDAAAGHQR